MRVARGSGLLQSGAERRSKNDAQGYPKAHISGCRPYRRPKGYSQAHSQAHSQADMFGFVGPLFLLIPSCFFHVYSSLRSTRALHSKVCAPISWRIPPPLQGPGSRLLDFLDRRSKSAGAGNPPQPCLNKRQNDDAEDDRGEDEEDEETRRLATR